MNYLNTPLVFACSTIASASASKQISLFHQASAALATALT